MTDYLPKYRLDEIEKALDSAMFLRALSAEEQWALNGLFLRCLNEHRPWLIMGPPEPVK